MIYVITVADVSRSKIENNLAADYGPKVRTAENFLHLRRRRSTLTVPIEPTNNYIKYYYATTFKIDVTCRRRPWHFLYPVASVNGQKSEHCDRERKLILFTY